MMASLGHWQLGGAGGREILVLRLFRASLFLHFELYPVLDFTVKFISREKERPDQIVGSDKKGKNRTPRPKKSSHSIPMFNLMQV